MLLVKNPQFLSILPGTQAISPDELEILTKYHSDMAKIVDFLIIAHFCASLIFNTTVSMSYKAYCIPIYSVMASLIRKNDLTIALWILFRFYGNPWVRASP